MDDQPIRTCPDAQAAHVLRFDSLLRPGCAVAIPCDAQGLVDIDALTERMRLSYLGARAMIGREYAFPFVERRH